MSGMSFTSFVDLGASLESIPVEPPRSEDATEGDEDFLEGEVVSSIPCEKVQLYSTFGDELGPEGRSGCSGTLLSTNFRLRFRQYGARKAGNSRSRILHDDHDVPLLAILECKINRFDDKHFRTVTAPVSAMDQVSELQVMTADHRFLHFDLKSSQHPGQLVNQIIHFARPSSLSGLCSWRVPASPSSVPSFNSGSGWDAELRRTGGSEGWRLSHFNNNHARVKSYPEVVVVPGQLTDGELEYTSEVWTHRRFPVWVWSSREGAALLRSASIAASAEGSQWAMQRRVAFERAISKAHPSLLHPKEFQAPFTAKDIRQSYLDLRKLLSVHSWKDWAKTDESWHGKLDSTGWQSLVATSLKATQHIIEGLQSGHSMILAEEEGRDATALLSSIVQLCLDPYYRSLQGLKLLIQKEWTSLGHPFALRLFGLSAESSQNEEEEKSPVFLLFLNCLYQLCRQFPDAFDFSEHFLIALWDLALSGLSLSFATNAMRDRQLLAVNLGSTWDLHTYYRSVYYRHFRNPLAMLRKVGRNASGQHLGISRAGQILRPAASIADLFFWESLWLRWAVPAQAKGAGPNQVSFALNRLQSQIQDLSAQLGGSESRRDEEMPPPAEIPSGYPYLRQTAGLVPRDSSVKTGEALERRASFSDFRSSKESRNSPRAKHRPKHPSSLLIHNGQQRSSVHAVLEVQELARMPQRPELRQSPLTDATTSSPSRRDDFQRGEDRSPRTPPNWIQSRLSDDSPVQSHPSPQNSFHYDQGSIFNSRNSPAKFRGKTEAQLAREAKGKGKFSHSTNV